MYTTIHTVDFDYVPEHSNDKVNYFKNRHSGFIIGEMKHSSGFEFYQATEDQMKRHLVGNYLGFLRSTAATGKEAGFLPYTDMHIPKTLQLNDEEFGE